MMDKKKRTFIISMRLVQPKSIIRKNLTKKCLNVHISIVIQLILEKVDLKSILIKCIWILDLNSHAHSRDVRRHLKRNLIAKFIWGGTLGSGHINVASVINHLLLKLTKGIIKRDMLILGKYFINSLESILLKISVN